MTHSDHPNLSAREMLAVKTIADYGSFNAAAITLNISQPVLTRTVQRVEAQLGITLFDRNTRSVEITEAGKEFVALSERVLNDMKIYMQAIEQRSDQKRGQIVISSVMSVACTVLPRIIARYKQIYPGVDLYIHEGVHGNVIENVRSSVADFGLTYLEDLSAMFDQRPLSTEAFHVVLSKGHPLEKRKQVAWDTLKNEQLISLPADSRTRRLIDATATTQGFQLKHNITVTQFTSMMQFVADGVGIAIVPEGSLAGAINIGLSTRPLVQPRVSRALGIITLKERDSSIFARAMMQQIESDWKKLRNNKS